MTTIPQVNLSEIWQNHLQEVTKHLTCILKEEFHSKGLDSNSLSWELNFSSGIGKDSFCTGSCIGGPSDQIILGFNGRKVILLFSLWLSTTKVKMFINYFELSEKSNAIGKQEGKRKRMCIILPIHLLCQNEVTKMIIRALVSDEVPLVPEGIQDIYVPFPYPKTLT